MKKKRIEVLVRGVCIVEARLLLCHTKGADNTYLPGGHVEFEESAPVALEREIREEMGLPCETGRFLGAVEHRFVQKEKLHSEINLIFEMTIPSLQADAVPRSEEDYIEFEWVNLMDLGTSSLEPAPIRSSLPRWLEASVEVAPWASTY